MEQYGENITTRKHFQHLCDLKEGFLEVVGVGKER